MQSIIPGSRDVGGVAVAARVRNTCNPDAGVGGAAGVRVAGNAVAESAVGCFSDESTSNAGLQPLRHRKTTAQPAKVCSRCKEFVTRIV